MGTIKTTNIQSITGSGTVTIGQSGETITVSGTPSGEIAMTPAFLVSNTGNNTGKSDNTYAKLTYNVETYDTDSAFDLSNNKFTVPSGKAGKYFFAITEFYAGDSAACNNFFLALYKNGSITTSRHYGNGIAFSDISPIFSTVLDLSAGDYIELYGRVNTDSGTWGQYAGGIWQGYRLIGV